MRNQRVTSLFQQKKIVLRMLVILIAFGRGWGEAPDTVTLKTVPMVAAPVIEKKILKYKIDFIFDRCPKNYWLFYNTEEQRLVIEFLGVHINAHPIKIQGTSILKDLSVINKETVMALNGKSSQISMVMEEGWHYEAWMPGDKILQLQLWMPLNPHKHLKNDRRKIFLPVSAISIALFGLVASLLSLIDAVRH